MSSILIRRLCSMAIFAGLFAFVLCSAALAASPDPLLDKFVGHWVLRGEIGGKQTVHDVDVQWVLNVEYLSIHEVSRQQKNGRAAYEAIIMIERNPKTGVYTCEWLDTSGGGGLSAAGLAHGKRSGDAIPFLFELPDDRMHTTFAYMSASDSWRWTIDDEANGKTTRFADVTLTKR
jgi:hypothetical protein